MIDSVGNSSAWSIPEGCWHDDVWNCDGAYEGGVTFRISGSDVPAYNGDHHLAFVGFSQWIGYNDDLSLEFFFFASGDTWGAMISSWNGVGYSTTTYWSTGETCDFFLVFDSAGGSPALTVLKE